MGVKHPNSVVYTIVSKATMRSQYRKVVGLANGTVLTSVLVKA